MIPPLQQWAQEPVYPAGPFTWSAAATKLAPTPDYFTPADKPRAQYWNYLLGAQAASLWYAQGAPQTVAALNWGTLFHATTFAGNAYLKAACWQGGLWWVAAVIQVSAVNYMSIWTRHPYPDFPNSVGTYGWTHPNNNTLSPPPRSGVAPDQNFVALAPDPTSSTVVWLGMVTSATHCGVWTFDGTSYTPQTSVNVATGQATVTMHTYNGRVLIGVGSTGGDEARIFVQPDNVGAVTFGLATIWRFADSGSFCVAMPGYLRGAPTFWTSPDGLTWSPQTIYFLNSNEQIFGVVYTQDADGPCFVAGINTNDIPRFVKSVDGLTWTPQSVPTTMAPGVDMAANTGSCIVVSTGDGYTTPYSVDGGVTWYPAYEATLGVQNPNFTEPPSAVSSGVGCLLFNTTSARFSLMQGLPAASM